MYFIIENQTRPDGQVNTTTTGRATINSALSFYHDRFSKMLLTELYTSVSLLLTDENQNVVEHHIVNTMYKAPQPQKPTLEEKIEKLYADGVLTEEQYRDLIEE